MDPPRGTRATRVPGGIRRIGLEFPGRSARDAGRDQGGRASPLIAIRRADRLDLAWGAGGRRSAARHAGELIEEVDRRLHRVVEVADVEALVLAVGRRVGILDAEEERGDAAEGLAEGAGEGD